MAKARKRTRTKSKPRDLIANGSIALADGTQFTGDDGQPHQLFIRDAIRAGRFVHPATGQAVDVPQKRLHHWANEFHRYTEAGNTVYMPLHTHRGESGGHVTDMWVEGDRLMVKLEAIGEDAIKAVARNKVSVRFPHDAWTDASGNTFEDFIEHVAIVPKPAIPGLGTARATAASADGEDIYLHTDLQTESDTMDWKELSKALGIKDVELSADNAHDQIVKAFEAARAATPEKVETELSAAKAKVTELEGKLADDKGGAIELSATERSLSKRLVRQQADQLVADGKITPAVRDKILADPAFISDTMLAATDDDSDPAALRLLSHLSENDLVKLGEQTKRQVVEMSAAPAGKETELSAEDKQRLDRIWGKRDNQDAA